MPEGLEVLMQDVLARISALKDVQMSEARVREIIKESVMGLGEDAEFVRKIRFGGGEQKMVGSKFARWKLDVADVEFLYDLMQAQRARGQAGPSEELQKVFGAVSEARYLDEAQVREIDRKAIDDLFPRVPVSWYPQADRKLAERGMWYLTGAYREAMRAMDTAESGYGSSLVGAQYVSDLWEGARKSSVIFALLNTFEMTDPTAYLPVDADLPEMLFVAENTANNSSAYTTSKTGSNRVTVSAKKFVIHQMWSGEMEEDSIIPFIPFLRMQAQKSLGFYTDSVVLNGDTTNAATGNINLDDADPADTKHYLAMDGMRHAAIVDNTGNVANHSGAAATYAALVALKKLMIDRTYLMDWGHPVDPSDLVFITQPETGDKLALLDEVITVDKYGSQATVLTGELARIGRNPLLTSIAFPLTEADGKSSTTAGNNTLGQVLAVNRRGYVAGWRRRVKVETARLPETDQSRIVYSLRMGLGRFSPTGAASGIEHTAVLYNIGI